MPTAVITATMSPIDCSGVGSCSKRSEMPIPRLSKWMNVTCRARYSSRRRYSSCSQPSSTLERSGGMTAGPRTEHLVGEVDVAAFRVVDCRDLLSQFLTQNCRDCFEE